MSNGSGIVIFGGTGDLAYRKLFPALYNLHVLEELPTDYQIIGIGRRDYSRWDYLTIVKEWLQKYSRVKYLEERFTDFSERIHYYKMDFDKAEQYPDLLAYFDEIKLQGEVIFYYAVAPQYFLPITKNLSIRNCRLRECKVIVEKPFGDDLTSAHALSKELKQSFLPGHVYYIDHYLGKEMILNIMTIRFFNSIFKGVWNKDFIESVQINAFETVGVESRGGYYDESGALRDMMQNHLFQILSIVAMEEPTAMESEEIKAAQLKVFQDLKPIVPTEIGKHLVLGQYAGYRQEDKVAPDSQTETYAAMKLLIDNERWQGVPFYIRTGKKLFSRESEVIIQFKQTAKEAEGNILIIKIQPDEGVYLKFNIKKPGKENGVQVVKMDFCQSCILENRINTPEAYERLLKACMNSDQSLFSKWDQIELCWNFIDQAIDSYQKYSGALYPYQAGTAGPKEADHLLLHDQHYWIEAEMFLEG
ncbi:glucose-6-phosphate dehydrogenase [Clostridiales bacterium COT073_COT-073]|nr:glucose-6-phosphate dehydrogenase [Clostridiales bacterium COT073_COT-073]